MNRSTAILQKGFRPFFILAAVFAAIYLPIWLTVLEGAMGVQTHWSGPLWHGHEMIYGFTVAVLAGFLLTAVSNWTGRDTATGWLLAGLAALWVAGRIAIAGSAYLPPVVVAVVDLLFVPALAATIGRCLVGTKNRRNYVFLLVLGLLFTANLLMHLDVMGVVENLAQPALTAAVDLIIVIALLIGGRIIPMFTRNATGDETIRSHPWIERSLFPVVIAASVAWQVAPSSPITSVLAFVAGGLALGRMTHWGFGNTLKSPILWVLHVGYAWIGIGLVLRGFAVFGAVPPTSATHALTAGAIGTLTLGMMARVARGHTARELRVEAVTGLAFVAVTFAAVVRVAVPILAPDVYMAAMIVSGVSWAAAFAVYLAKYTPILWKPRVDGRPG